MKQVIALCALALLLAAACSTSSNPYASPPPQDEGTPAATPVPGYTHSR